MGSINSSVTIRRMGSTQYADYKISVFVTLSFNSIFFIVEVEPETLSLH